MNQSLISFIIKAKKSGYANGGESIVTKESDHSKSIRFVEGDYSYHDNYFGGEPYGGREVVFKNDQPVWMMVYYGWVEPTANAELVYKHLQKALLAIPENAPFRGDKELVEGNAVYKNNWEGDVTRFFGTEVITIEGEKVYEASYRGGLVDVQKDI